MRISRKRLTFFAIAFSSIIVLFALVSIPLIFGLDFDRSDFDENRPPVAFGFIFIAIVSGLGTITGFLAMYYYYPEIRQFMGDKKKISSSSSPLDVVLYISTPEEAQVIAAIDELQQRTYQFEIARVTGLSRMKVHRILKRLEERDIVHRDQDGRGGRVFLSTWLTGENGKANNKA